MPSLMVNCPSSNKKFLDQERKGLRRLLKFKKENVQICSQRDSLKVAIMNKKLLKNLKLGNCVFKEPILDKIIV
jgi:hypothetical protein